MKVIIAGGGIGGCATAYALQQRGIEVEVYEKKSELKEVGAGLSLWSNATRALRLIGLSNIVETLSGPIIDGGYLVACNILSFARKYFSA